MTKLIQVFPHAPDPDSIGPAASALRKGQVIGFPTETVYGLGAIMSNAQALEQIYTLKNRRPDQPLSVHLADYQYLRFLRLKNAHVFSYLSGKYWPGPVTFIVQDQDGRSIGLRMPANIVARMIIAMCGEPIYATSANISGQPSPTNAQEVLNQFEGKIPLLIDSGPCENGKDSTIVDLRQKPFKLVREGTHSSDLKADLQNLNEGNHPTIEVLIVCTGNTCRSPMAEAWLQHQAKLLGFENKVKISSCGILAYKNMPATSDGQSILAAEGINMSAHRSRMMDQNLVCRADLIYAMTSEHEQFILKGMPYMNGRIEVMHISDPVGMGLQAYKECFQEIKTKLVPVIHKIQEWTRNE